MYKTIRILLASLSILAVTLLFVDFTGTARSLWPWLAKIQFIPALLSINVLALIIILGMTLLLGRVYCSVICPLGIFQDITARIGMLTAGKRRRRKGYGYSKPRTRWRLGVLTVFAVLVVLGLTHALAASIAGLIEPYSAYGRIATQILAPAYDGVNNLLASWAESHDSYMFYRVVCAVSVPLLVVAIITMVTVVAFAWRGGRDYCNTICPVGTILGYLSKWSLLKIVIDTDKCVNCGKCGRACKAKCINTKAHDIDYTRCVVCMDCIYTCSEGAISYTWRRPVSKADAGATKATDKGRRGFVTGAGFIVGALAQQSMAKTVDGGLTRLKNKHKATRSTRIVPAGAVSLAHLSRHCTACQLCIQGCPRQVLRPSTSLDGFMQPELDYTDGYCMPSCTKCSELCPAGAFHPVDVADKTAIKIGTAVVDLDTCISASEGKKCGNCARNCPAGAIKMIPRNPDDETSPLMPMVNDEACIGCGACEYYCPVGTVADMAATSSAIHVEGIEVHREI